MHSSKTAYTSVNSSYFFSKMTSKKPASSTGSGEHKNVEIDKEMLVDTKDKKFKQWELSKTVKDKAFEVIAV